MFSPLILNTLPANNAEDFPGKLYDFAPVRMTCRSRLQVPDAALVEACCLLDVLESMDCGQPHRVIFGVKTDVAYLYFIFVWVPAEAIHIHRIGFFLKFLETSHALGMDRYN